MQDVTLPSLNDFVAVNLAILHADAYAIHAPWLRDRPGDYAQLTRSSLLTGAFLTADDSRQAQRARGWMIERVGRALGEVDVLLTASSMGPAARIDDTAEVPRTYPRQARTLFDVTGHPALAMMPGLSAGGLPLSVRFVAGYFRRPGCSTSPQPSSGLRRCRVAQRWRRTECRCDRIAPSGRRTVDRQDAAARMTGAG